MHTPCFNLLALACPSFRFFLVALASLKGIAVGDSIYVMVFIH